MGKRRLRHVSTRRLYGGVRWLIIIVWLLLDNFFLVLAISLDILDKRHDALRLVGVLMEAANCSGIDRIVISFTEWLFVICAVTCCLINKSLIACTKTLRVLFIILLLVYVFLQTIIV